jgi:hypothetical protein
MVRVFADMNISRSDHSVTATPAVDLAPKSFLRVFRSVSPRIYLQACKKPLINDACCCLMETAVTASSSLSGMIVKLAKVKAPFAEEPAPWAGCLTVFADVFASIKACHDGYHSQ